MRRTDLVLLGTVAQANIALAASLPRGVGPEFAKFYDPSKATFQCIGHPSTVLTFDEVNNNYCDCPDGSDEPGTTACAHLSTISPEQVLPGSAAGTTKVAPALPGYWCPNEGHIGAYVPFAAVNDGICDYDLCCDGSDEFAHVGGIKCENRCAAIGKEYRKVEEEKRKTKEKAVKKRRTLVKEARQVRKNIEAKIVALKEEIKEAETKRDEFKKKLDEVERSERGKVVRPEGTGGKLGVLLGLAKSRVKELRDTLDKVLDQRDDLSDRVQELETILKKFKEEYNPNFNDEGVKAAVKGWEDYAAKQEGAKKASLADSEVLEILKEDSATSGVNWAEFEEEGSDTDILYNFEAYLPGFMRDFMHSKLNLLRIWLIENGLMADNPSSGGESKLVTAAREQFQEAADAASSKGSSLGEQERDLETDYGPDDIFRAMKGKCVSIDTGEYDYELCWLDRTSQKSKKGHGNTNMGNFVRIDTETADEEDRPDGKSLGKGPRTVLRYDNGQHCWNGPNRRTDVWLGCAETEEVWRVVEAEKCVYKMEVGTPAACEDVQDPAVSSKEEL